jgi:hypothetical protein
MHQRTFSRVRLYRLLRGVSLASTLILCLLVGSQLWSYAVQLPAEMRSYLAAAGADSGDFLLDCSSTDVTGQAYTACVRRVWDEVRGARDGAYSRRLASAATIQDRVTMSYNVFRTIGPLDERDRLERYLSNNIGLPLIPLAAFYLPVLVYRYLFPLGSKSETPK